MFKDSYMIFSCMLRRHQSKIKALVFADSSTSAYVFIDQKFAQHYSFAFFRLKCPRKLRGFDGQLAISGIIIHVAKVIKDLNGHVETLVM